MKLKGLDYLGLEKHISEEEIMTQHNTRDFGENEINPVIEKHFHDGTFPDYLIPKIADMGFLGINIPEEYGGGGMSHITYGIVCQELERCDSGIRSFVSVQGSLVIYPIFDIEGSFIAEKPIPYNFPFFWASFFLFIIFL